MSEKEFNILTALVAGMPWKARLAVFACVMFGPSILFAGFFAALWTGIIPSPVTRNTELLLQNQQLILGLKTTLDLNLAAMKAEISDSQAQQAQMVRLQLATCRNVAKNEAGVRECDGYWRH